MSVDTAIKTGFLYFGKRKTSRVGTPLSQLTLRVQSIAKAFFRSRIFFRRTTHGEGCSQFMRANSAEKKSHRENTAFAIDCTVLLSNVPLMTTAMYVGISVCLYVKVFLDALAGNTFMYSQRSCQVSCVSSV
jgi:hypothetical protein